MGFNNKVFFGLLLAGLLPALVVSMFVLNLASDSISKKTLHQLESLREFKKKSVDNYLKLTAQQISTLSRSQIVLDGIVELSDAYEIVSLDDRNDSGAILLRKDVNDYYQESFISRLKEVDPGHNTNVENLVQPLSTKSLLLQNAYISGNQYPVGEKQLLDFSGNAGRYDTAHKKIHPFLREYLERFSYYDIFLINPAGEVIYSVYKEVDFATSLADGPYARSGLAQAYRSANKTTASRTTIFVDFQRYLPSFNTPAGFIAKSIMKGNENLGTLVFQFPIDKLNAIMGQRSGLGKTGESYLLGADKLMRSDSYLSPKTHSVENSFRRPSSGFVDTGASQAAARGETGARLIKDHAGRQVLSAFSPLGFDGLDWSILVEIDEAEAMAQVNKLTIILIVAMVVCFVAIVAIALYLSGVTPRPLDTEPECIQTSTKNIAQGVVSVNTTPGSSKTSMYSSVRGMAKNLRAMVSQINLAAASQTSTPTSTPTQFSAVTNLVSVNNDKKSQEILAPATSIQQIFTSVMQVTQTTEAANDARIQDKENVEAAISASSNVKKMAESLNCEKDEIESRQTSSNDVPSILQTITGIADQANLLALNAVIEAARVGEHGRGFTVVSEEVRSLAGHTQAAKEQISQMISGLINASDDTGGVMDSSADLALTISKEAVAAASRLKDAAESVRKITDMAGQIASASTEQTQVAESVSVRITPINAISVESGSSVEEILSSSDELSKLSIKLQALVQQFKS